MRCFYNLRCKNIRENKPIYTYVNISAVKRLITINHIQYKGFCLHNICMCTVLYIYYVYINTHTYSVYLKNIYIYTHIYILYYIFIYFIYKHKKYFLYDFHNNYFFFLLLMKKINPCGIKVEVTPMNENKKVRSR